MANLTLSELMIALAFSDLSIKPTITGNGEMTLIASDGVNYIYDVELSPEVKLTPRKM